MSLDSSLVHTYICSWREVYEEAFVTLSKRASLINQHFGWQLRVNSCPTFQGTSPYRFRWDVTKKSCRARACAFIDNMQLWCTINVHDVQNDSFIMSHIFSSKRHSKASKCIMSALTWITPFGHHVHDVRKVWSMSSDMMSWRVSNVFFAASSGRTVLLG